jgi:hypothetical protein
MFSDGLHNFSDAVSLGVAFWAEKKKLAVGTDDLTCVPPGCYYGKGLTNRNIFVAIFVFGF